jgi:excisionase family DNA binding protein
MQIQQQEPKRLSHKQRLAQAPALKDAAPATPRERVKANTAVGCGNPEQTFLRVLEAAHALACSRQRIYELVRLGCLPFSRLGGTSIRIPKIAIDRMVAEALERATGTDEGNRS